jgi:diaminopropionate ammonia-lyase
MRGAAVEKPTPKRFDPKRFGPKRFGPKRFDIVANPLARPPEVWAPYTRQPLALHRRLPGYAVTPLFSAPRLAERLGVRQLLVKAETARFGLPSFKMLGASWAAYRAVVDRTGEEPPEWSSVDELAQSLSPLRPFALAAATDGNHGRAVARMARLLGFDARIFVPQGTAAARAEAIAGEGASLSVVEGDYDDAVARSAEEAGPRCLVISDTSWPGYERVPRWVIEGYSTIFWEIDDCLVAAGRHAADVIVVPIGVGALAAAAVNHYCRRAQLPPIVGVEPLDANCVMASAVAGRPTAVPGPHRSIMVGLNCGNPSPVAWPLVSAGVRTLVAVDDETAREAVRDLAAIGVETGETGAAALAGLIALQQEGNEIAGDATVLVICTEGVTDPVEWRRSLGVEVL